NLDPKSGYNLDLKARYQGKSGEVVWKKVQPNAQGYVDLRAFFAGNSDQIVSYLYCEIESPIEQKAHILLGTDDCAKLWVNGKALYTNMTHRAAVPEQDEVKVRLIQGKNTLFLKISNGDGDHGFYLTILSETELKAAAVK